MKKKGRRGEGKKEERKELREGGKEAREGGISEREICAEFHCFKKKPNIYC